MSRVLSDMKIEKNICLNISIFIFCLLLSFIIDLHIFIELTVKAKIQGKYIKFCKNSDEKENIKPFQVPSIFIVVAMV